MFVKMKNLVLRKLRGYTMAELLVAIGVFAIVVSIAVGGFARALRTHRQAAALMAANNNISFAIEQMAREIRTGFDFNLIGTALSFDNANNEYVIYDFASNGITRGGASPTTKITDENVIVEYLHFTLMNVLNYPPRIIINVGVRPNAEGVSAGLIHLQTTVSSRNI